MTSQITLSSGRRLSFDEYGDPKGAPAFYFHGWPSSAVQGVLMDGVAKEFGLRVISPDRPGMGGSDFHPGRRLLDWPPLLAELAAHLGWEKFHVFGVSGGGPYALVTAHAMPERVLSVSVVCGAPPLKQLGTRDLFWIYRLILVIRKWCPSLLGLVFAIGTRISHRRPDQIPMRWLLSLLHEADREVLHTAENLDVIAEGFRESLASGVPSVMHDADMYLTDWGYDLADIRVPVHFWHGKEDRNIPWTYAEKIAAQIPITTTQWFDGDGHYSLAVRRCREVARLAMGK